MCNPLFKKKRGPVYTLRNREPGFITIQLHPPQILQSRFTSIKLFFYITAAASYPHSVRMIPHPHASYSGKALQVHNFIWCEDEGAPHINES